MRPGTEASAEEGSWVGEVGLGLTGKDHRAGSSWSSPRKEPRSRATAVMEAAGRRQPRQEPEWRREAMGVSWKAMDRLGS